MKINIVIPTEEGPVTKQVAVYCAVSDTLAFRVVPLNEDGTEAREATQSVVGGNDDEAVAEFLDSVSKAAQKLIARRITWQP